MRRLMFVALAALLGAAADTALTWNATPWRPQGADLALQTLAGWALLALVLAWPAVRLGRKLRAPLSTALIVVVAPVFLHHMVRTPLRTSGLGGETLMALGLGLAVLLVALAVLVWLERAVMTAGVRRLASALLVVVALVALWPGGATADDAPAVLAERRDAPAGRPNLLLLVWDTTRAMELGTYGNPRGLTPHLDALADQGAVFEEAWSSSVFTLSSHASMLTGLPPSLHGTGLRRQQVRATTLATRLKALGYRTGAFVGTSVLRGGGGLERDFDVYDDRVDPAVCDTHLWSLVHDLQVLAAALVPALRGNGLPHGFQDFQRPGGEVLDAALDFVNRDDPRPWFVFVNLFDVHWPYLPGDEARRHFVADYDGPLGGYLFRADDYPEGYTPDERDKAHMVDLYGAEMWELDRRVDAFLDGLDLERGDVRVVLTSDHGEGLGEGDLWSHEHLAAPQTRVPFIVYAPGVVEPGTRSRRPVAGYDVAPTILALAGMPAEVRATLDMAGRAAHDGAPERDIFIQDFDNTRPALDSHALVRGGFKLLRRDGVDTLHDVLIDPLDHVDLSAEHPELAADMAAALDALLEATVASDDGPLDNMQALQALGYLDAPAPAPDRESGETQR